MELVLGALRDGVEDVMAISRWRLKERVREASRLVWQCLAFVGVSKDVRGVGLEVQGEGFVVQIFATMEIVFVFIVVLVDIE
jgi:hypothetical protein